MSELDKLVPSQAEVDALLDPETLSGKQIAILRKLDEKNLDQDDLAILMQQMLDSYNAAKQGGVEGSDGNSTATAAGTD